MFPGFPRRKTLQTAQNPYDIFAYPGLPNPSTHPDRLAAMAILHGLTPAPVANCRVLEIACGDGANLIPMAYAIPGSEFAGFDLARLPIERGQDRIRELGLRNVRVFEMDLLSAGAELGQFDYIISHGLYAWVPEPVRDRLLALCGQLLVANGVAFISYNALPGGYLRSMIREMMLYGVKDAGNPENRVADGLKFLDFLRETRPEGDVYRALLDLQLEQMKKRNPAAIYHDELGGEYHPVRFIDFAEHSGRHGLQYLCEAELPPPPDPCYRKEIRSELERATGADFLKQEQILDFARMRMYRETLLSRAGAVLRRDFPPENFRRLLFASQTTAIPGKAPGARAFVLPGGISMESNHPGVIALLEELGRAWPCALGFEELEAAVAGTGLSFDGEGAALLIRLAVAKMIEFRGWRAPVARAIPERPKASACSRHEARSGAHATSLLHKTVSLDDARVRSLLRLLDGTRDRNNLLEAMKAEFPDMTAAELEEGLDRNLQYFHIAGMLEA